MTDKDFWQVVYIESIRRADIMPMYTTVEVWAKQIADYAVNNQPPGHNGQPEPNRIPPENPWDMYNKYQAKLRSYPAASMPNVQVGGYVQGTLQTNN